MVDLPTPYSDFGPFWRPMNFFWISARCRPLLDFGKLSALLDFGPLSALLDFGPLSASFGFRPVVGPFGFWPVVGPLGFQPVVGLFWISARCRPSWILARRRPLLEFGPLSAHLNLHSAATCRRCWPLASLYLLWQSPPSMDHSPPPLPPSS
jgi:hypothetical protein